MAPWQIWPWSYSDGRLSAALCCIPSSITPAVPGLELAIIAFKIAEFCFQYAPPINSLWSRCTFFLGAFVRERKVLQPIRSRESCCWSVSMPDTSTDNLSSSISILMFLQ